METDLATAPACTATNDDGLPCRKRLFVNENHPTGIDHAGGHLYASEATWLSITERAELALSPPVETAGSRAVATEAMILRVLRENWPTDSRHVEDWHPEDQKLYRKGAFGSFDHRAAAILEQRQRRIAALLVGAIR